MVTVRKTAQERAVLHRMAPHLCEPNWMVFPTAKRRTVAKLTVGVTTYEKLGSVADADRHQVWGGDDLAEHAPMLDRSQFSGAVVWREYITDDARLVLANLRDAVADGAAVLNHCRVTAVTGDGSVDGVTASCDQTGETLAVRARALVNAAGPWVDAVRSLEGGAETRLVLSKGIHLVVPRDRFPLETMVTLPTPDKRSIFVVPRGPVSYIGTTDTLYPGDASVWPAITLDDATYLLDVGQRSVRRRAGDPGRRHRCVGGPATAHRRRLGGSRRDLAP